MYIAARVPGKVVLGGRVFGVYSILSRRRNSYIKPRPWQFCGKTECRQDQGLV